MAFPTQTFFYCENGHFEAAMEIAEASSTSNRSIIVFRCPLCRSEVVCKLELSQLKQLGEFLAKRLKEHVVAAARDRI